MTPSLRHTCRVSFFTVFGIFIATVKKRVIVKIEGGFEAEALRILRGTPGMTVVAEPRGLDRGVDAIIRFAGTRATVAIEFKHRANAATAWQLVQYARANPKRPIVVIAGETTAQAREILGDHNIGLIDGLGNAHIELPGLLFHLEGPLRESRPATTGPPTKLSGKAGLAAQALLLHPDRGWQIQDLAKDAGVSAGLAHRVLERLEEEAIVTSKGTGPKRVRRVANRTALLDLWTEENVERPTRTLGHVLAQTPQQLITKLGTNLERAGIDYALTGAAGASLLAPFVTAVPVVDVWVTATAAPDELRHKANAEPVTSGQNVVFLQAKDDTPLAFREQAKRLWVANRFRLYGDLLLDPRRGREQAEHLRREVIKF